MPTIGIWVDDETWKKWKILNEFFNKGTKELKKRVQELLEENRDWIEWKVAHPDGEAAEYIYERYVNTRLKGVDEFEDAVSDREILAEI